MFNVKKTTLAKLYPIMGVCIFVKESAEKFQDEMLLFSIFRKMTNVFYEKKFV